MNLIIFFAVLVGISDCTLLFEEKFSHRASLPHSSFGEDEFASSDSHLLLTINGALILHSELILKFVDGLVVDLFKVPLGDHELSVLEIVIRLVDIEESYDNRDCGHQKNFNCRIEYLIFE